MNNKLVFPCIKVNQPIGDFFIGSIKYDDLLKITFTDTRRPGEFDNYIGIQRKLDPKRVEELKIYVNTVDACFPTSIILSIPAECVSFNEKENKIVLTEYLDASADEQITFDKMAKVIDGQHRIAGLENFKNSSFEVNVSIFVGADLSDQAYIFSTVNLAQTKVNKSLAYDLYDLAKTRSPQKICHQIAVALDNNEKSPLHKRIKRLGLTTAGRTNETITQATFVESLLKHICKDKIEQIHFRNIYLNNKKPKKVPDSELTKYIFKNMFIEEQDIEIAKNIWNYFEAIKERWNTAWYSFETGNMLNRTNGFRGFMRFLKPAYLSLGEPGRVANKEEFTKILDKINLKDEDFNTNKYQPGGKGENDLYNDLCRLSEISDV